MRSVGVLVYPHFELLDLFGPLEMFGWLASDFELTMIGPTRGTIRSNMGIATVADATLNERSNFDVLLVPGGWGRSIPVDTEPLLPWLTEAAKQADRVLTVCTGSALLALTGLLDGRKATTNKALFHWVADKRPEVEWQHQARWVRDGKFWTSSGVSAGMDMALAAIAYMLGATKAEEIARGCEYEWHRDPAWDAFARLHGLV
ncbi:MAG: DJ-1/PfpI family protein [Alphaproteobacteria bacterium]|nr:DJ-1/PfpI family protein [Alphaproteobacteria bacterium]